ncbi:hypothetical protein [Nonlabens xylanidelens]|nr:hypothetical protein [Nonlabens xylanidelens]
MTFGMRPAYQASYYLYFQMNIDVIVAKYCVNKERPQLKCNGKCHLNKQITLAAQEDAGTNSKTVQLANAFYPIFFQVIDNDYLTPVFSTHIHNNFRYHNSYRYSRSWSYNPPPRLLS